jgi:hypothetical protein
MTTPLCVSPCHSNQQPILRGGRFPLGNDVGELKANIVVHSDSEPRAPMRWEPI